MIEVDGSLGEGGGQILRSALAFSSLLRKPVRVYNIRAGRRPPGLKPSHITAIKAIASITSAEVRGLYRGSMEITFKPNEIRSGEFSFDIGTAGSITLVLQAILPVAAFAPGPIRIRLRGGTAVSNAPTIHYFERVFLEALKRMNVNVSLKIIRMGYYPRGGGIVEAYVSPVEYINAIKLESLGSIKPRGVVFSSNLPKRVSRDIIRSASEIIRRNLDTEIEFEELYYDALDRGCGGLIYTIDRGVVGHDRLCSRGVHATKIGSMLARGFLDEIRSSPGADRHLADHLIIWSSVARGESIIRASEITMHTRTQIELLKLFLPQAEARIEGKTIYIKGIGMRSSG